MIAPLLRYVEETVSTNDDVMALVLADTPHGTAVYAGVQTAARGRQGRPWFSAPNTNLALSVALIGERFAPWLGLIPLAVGVAMAERIQHDFGVNVGLKWPNDLYVQDKKIGGILCEGVQTSARFRGAVAGVGINLNVAADDFPSDVRAIATSIHIETGVTVDVERFAAAARTAILTEVEALASGGRDALLKRWEQRDVTRGRRVLVVSTGQQGYAEGIERDGALRVWLDSGERVALRSGEVHLLRADTDSASFGTR